MNSISTDHLNRISHFTNANRSRARVILNRFWWENFSRTYRNSADLLILNATQAEALLDRLDREWDADSARMSG